MTTEHTPPAIEEEAELSATAVLLQEMTLYGYRPYSDEPDQRPLPEPRQAAGAVADMFDAMVATFVDTRLEPDLEDLLWGIVNVFHRAGERVERELDDNEVAQKTLQREQDGSEVRSEELERRLREGHTLIERRDAMEFFREAAAEQYRLHTRNAWTPRTGSRVNRRKLTATLIDSRDFARARKRADAKAMMPAGPKIAFAGGIAANDHALIWQVLDKVRAKHPDMVLLHGGADTGAERIAQCWAEDRGVPAIAFKPKWGVHRRAAPFKRNDELLAELPQGVIVFSGTGIQDNLADKARKMGLAVMDFRNRGGA